MSRQTVPVLGHSVVIGDDLRDDPEEYPGRRDLFRAHEEIWATARGQLTRAEPYLEAVMRRLSAFRREMADHRNAGAWLIDLCFVAEIGLSAAWNLARLGSGKIAADHRRLPPDMSRSVIGLPVPAENEWATSFRQAAAGVYAKLVVRRVVPIFLLPLLPVPLDEISFDYSDEAGALEARIRDTLGGSYTAEEAVLRAASAVFLDQVRVRTMSEGKRRR